ncbi:hypothetical protein SCREM2_gp199 [Synechococcus phage S-CREM2]|nr:hypothetical protein SCREM2_gp199 [Synechococcus phage S-CREM2]
MNDESFEFLFEEMNQVEYLQQYVTEMIWDAANSSDTKYLEEYYHHFYALMEKQHILWTRLKLMQKEELYGMLIAIEEICNALGKPPSMSVEAFHTVTREEIKKSLSELTGENLDDYDGIEVDFRW